jgi:hypothetical protein
LSNINAKKMIAGALLVSCLASCVQFPRYIDSIDSDSAAAVFVNNTGFNASLRTFDEPNYCSGQKWIYRLTESSAGKSREFKIDTNTAFTIDLTLEVDFMNSCSVVATFNPEKNKKYTIEFQYEDEYCSVNITNPYQNNITHTLKEKIRPFNSDGKWCREGPLNNSISDKITMGY